MANVFTKSEKIARTALGLLVRDTVLARTVWRDAGGDFAGAKGDTVTVRLPAYAQAKTRALRSGATRQKGKLVERAVPVTLDTNIYEVIEITDEELTLDIESFNEQVNVPIMAGIARALEDAVAAEMQGADYHHEVAIDPDSAVSSLFAARRLLNDSRVPLGGRTLAVGSAVEELLLTSDNFIKADESGSDQALREAIIGRAAGFQVVAAPALDPNEAVAYHQTAFALSSRAPVVPAGAPHGTQGSYDGFAIRLVQALDPDEVVDNVHGDVFSGTNTVTDHGSFNEAGQFTPSVDPNAPEGGEGEVFVRAAHLTLGGDETGGGA